MKVKFIGSYDGKVSEFIKECKEKNNIFTVRDNTGSHYEIESNHNRAGYWMSHKDDWVVYNEYEVTIDEGLFEL
jgi:hypothetical protein